jgi:serine/threonine protein kinase
MAKASGGRLLAERYQLKDRRRAGAVEARDLRSGAPVLLEAVPLPELVTPYDQAGRMSEPEEDDARALALRHAAAAATAVPDHPRLGQAFQVFAEDGYLWVAGEWLAGVPLVQLLERGPLSPYRAAELAYDLSAGLAAVHRAGLVHGNLTTATVTVCEDGAALLGGLSAGAAQEALCGGPGSVEPGASVPTALWSPARVRARDARAVIVGATPERWAPEQLGLVGDVGMPVGPTADSWALGVLLYRSVTGVPPYPETGVDELFDAIRAGFRPDTRSTGPLRPLLDRLLDQDPTRRPGLAQIRAALRQLLQRAPEPLDRDAEPDGLPAGGEIELPTGTRLPVPRPGHLPAQRSRSSRASRASRAVPVSPESAEPVVRPGQERHHHAAPRRRNTLLGPLLVGAIILVVLVTLVLAASIKG